MLASLSARLPQSGAAVAALLGPFCDDTLDAVLDLPMGWLRWVSSQAGLTEDEASTLLMA